MAQLFSSAGLRGQSEPAKLAAPAFDSSAGARFEILPPLDKAHRIDFTHDFLDWYPLEVLPAATPARTLADRASTNDAARFYRSVEIEAAPGIYGYEPDPVGAGETLAISGQFFAAVPAQNRVTIAGMEARVIEASATQLKVEVPAGAQSGTVRVTTPAGEAIGATDLTVAGRVTVRLAVPAGFNTANLLAASGVDAAEIVAGSAQILVPKGLPAAVFAVSRDTNRPVFLAEVLTNAAGEATLDAHSTARAMVFLNPFAAHSEPLMAAKLLETIRASAAVRQLGEALGRALARPGDPLADPEVASAYTNAIVAVLESPGLAQAALERQSRRALQRQSAAANGITNVFHLEPPETRWLGVELKPGKFSVSPAFDFNPVDWLVRYHEIDVTRAFPEGRYDFQAILREASPLPEAYPLRAGFDETRSVSADLASSRLNLVSYLSKALFTLIAGKGVDSSVPYLREDTIYLVRGIGPSFLGDSLEHGFVLSHYREEHYRVLAINLVAALVDAVSAAFEMKKLDGMFRPDKKLKDWDKLYFKLILEATKIAPTVKSVDDFAKGVVTLSKFFFKELASNLGKLIVGAAESRDTKLAEAMQRTGEEFTKLGDAAGKLLDNKALKVAAAAGQVIERASGLLRTTPMETTFIQVGDPFKLDVGASPAVAGLGEEITITIRGSAALKAFRTNSTRDQVNFEGPVLFDGQVLSVSAPENGEQRLRVRIPVSLPNNADGSYTMFVNTQGRRGSAPFRVALKTTITDLLPRSGFAAVADFAGSPFAGSSIIIQGANMSSQDVVLFPSAAGTVAAVTKSAVSGGLRVNVPLGATTGPIVVNHRNLNGELTSATSAVFTVLGPPAIEAMEPRSGPPGTLLTLRLANAGDNSTARIQFPLGFPNGVTFIGTNTIIAPVPTGSTTGPVRIITPAGFAEREFIVTAAPAFTNLQGGSQIFVGGNSLIALERGFAMANGGTFPEDDTDYVIENGRRTELDPPREEGDYVQPDNIGLKDVPRYIMGLFYSDTIQLQSPQSGTVTMLGDNDRLNADPGLSGELTVASKNCFLNGNFHGTVRITGHFNSLSGVANGTVIVTGDSNRLNGRFTGPVIVEGNYNTLSGEFNDTVTLLGQFNKFGLQTSNVRSNKATAVIVRGDNNTVAANFRNNATNVVEVLGAKFTTIDFNNCTTNGGHGLVLKDGASFNTVVMRSGVQVSRQVVPGSGNAGHAVLLQGSASHNAISGEFSGNGLDGLMMDGAGVHDNKINGEFLRNGRNGITVQNGAHQNSLGAYGPFASQFTKVECNGNGQNGVAILGGLQTTGGLYASTNGACGLLFSNVVEEVPQGTYFILLTAPFTGNSGNGQAGLRLAGKVSGVTVVNPGYRLKLDAVGVDLDGEEVTGNTLDLRVTESAGAGVTIKKARRNNLRFEVSKAGGAGIVLDGAANNDVRLSTIEDNKGPGLLVTGVSAENKIGAAVFSASLRRNQNGIRIEAGSHDNRLDLLDVAANGEYGLILTGAGTSQNVVLGSTFVGATKDGVLIENGASDNTIGNDNGNPFSFGRAINLRDNGLTGMRITGPLTKGNSIVRALFLPTADVQQPSGLRIENGATATTVTGCTFTRNRQGILVTDGAKGVIVAGGNFHQNSEAAIVVSNATTVTIGGQKLEEQNQIANGPIGVVIAGAAARQNRVVNNWIHDNQKGVVLREKTDKNQIQQNRIELNSTGVEIDEAAANTVWNNSIANNTVAGVQIHRGAARNRIDYNLIKANGTGVSVAGATSVENTITRNSIFGHLLTGAGILLSSGGNLMIEPPKPTEVQFNAIVGTSTAPDDSVVELFTDFDDEGEVHIGSGVVTAGRFRVPVEIDPNEAGFLFNVTATVTDPDGNTSEFGMLEREEFPESRLVFSSNREGNTEIYMSGGGTGGMREPANLSRSVGRDESPSLAAGCGDVLFVSDRDGNLEIYKAPAQPNSAVVRLTSNSAADYDPSWLIPCQKVVFVSERDGNAEIYSMNADGTTPARLTTNPARDRWPRVSPDGGRILFVSDRGGSSALWIMNADGSDPRPLTAAGVPGSEPAWSPTGTHIAFVSSRDGNPEIYVIGADGSGLVRLTNDSGTDAQPAWAPGGRQLLFSSNRTGNYEIYAISRNGGSPARLTVTTSDNFTPSAQPK